MSRARTDKALAGMATHFLLLCLLAGMLAGVVAAPATPPNTTTFDCPKTYRCGHNIEIKYPFWVGTGGAGDNTTQHCGYPALRLECRHGTPVLPLPSGDIGVTRITYGDGDGDRTLSVFDMGVLNNSKCPVIAARNFTAPPPLALTGRDGNLSFVLDCPLVGAYEDHVIPCLKNGGNSSYVFRDGVPRDAAMICQHIVVMPALSLLGDVVTALAAGFELNWSPVVDGDCGRCEEAGGFCSADDAATCFTSKPKGRRARVIVWFALLAFILLVVFFILGMLYWAFCGPAHGAEGGAPQAAHGAEGGGNIEMRVL